jgi:endo-beta-N-acetylglucosaminidase D
MQNELRVNEEMEKILKKGNSDIIEVLFLNFAVGNEENKRTVRCAGWSSNR